jgi:nicotinate-nucleotide adenylyltransferase
LTEAPAQAVFGGTFNPIHYGHLRSAQALFEYLPIGHLRFVPARLPPHREEPQVRAEHRAAMVERAIAGDPRLSCDRRELDRDGPSYTVDTLESLRSELGAQAPLVLVLGCDAFLGFDTWHRWQAILRLAHLVVMARPGWVLPNTGPVGQLLEENTGSPSELASVPAGSIVAVELEPWPVSSTEIRALLQSGSDVSTLVPGASLDYALEHRLYTGNGAQP